MSSDVVDFLSEEVTDEEHEEITRETAREEIERRAASIRAEQAARRLVRAEEAARDWTPPWFGQPVLLGEQLALPRESPKYLIERLMGWNHNVGLAAQHGIGKTTFGQNVVRSLVDGKPFLEREVTPFDGRVAWINGEMDRNDWLDYIGPLKIKKVNRVAALHLRDGRLPLMNDHAAEQFVKWLRDQDIAVLILDSWRRLCAWNGVDENVNAEVELLTARIDQIKAESGVHAFLTIAHTGRAKVEAGEERVRGATALDDWVDARWVMARDRETDGRYFWAEKRQVEMRETRLMFDAARNRVSLGEGNRRTNVDPDSMVKVAMVVKANPGLATTKVAAEMGFSDRDTTKINQLLNKAQEEGLVHHLDNPSGRGVHWHPDVAPAGARACRDSCQFRQSRKSG